MANPALDRYITGNYGEDQFRESIRPFDPQQRMKDALEDILHIAKRFDNPLEYIIQEAEGALFDVEQGVDSRD